MRVCVFCFAASSLRPVRNETSATCILLTRVADRVTATTVGVVRDVRRILRAKRDEEVCKAEICKIHHIQI